MSLDLGEHFRALSVAQITFFSFVNLNMPRQEMVIHHECAAKDHQKLWDSLIICSAKKSGCDVIRTEDFNNGQRYEGVVVLNPFSG